MSDERERKVAVLDSSVPVQMGDEQHRAAGERRITGVVLGRMVALVNPDSALVVPNGSLAATPVRVRRICPLASEDIGKEVALMYEEGDPSRPIILGRVETAPGAHTPGSGKQPVSIDADSILLNGAREIVLRCGEATLILKRDGKLILRGAYVETQASGVNRIKGGCVKIN